MKKYLFICLYGLLVMSCSEDAMPSKTNSMAEDLKQVIKKEGVEALGYCCVGCTCEQTIGWGTDYSFPGDNFVRIQATTYNLNILLYYEIETFGVNPNTEKRLTLYFNQ